MTGLEIISLEIEVTKGDQLLPRKDFPGFSNRFEYKELSSSGGLPLGGY